MRPRPFRFGLVAARAAGADDWARQARQAEDLGYATLLVPDTLDTLAPLPALVAAAAATSYLRVGSYVLATCRREPEAVAWEATTAHLLTDGRLELGLGVGRSAAAHEAERLGLAFGSPAQRLARLAATIAAVRQRTPGLALLVAARGREALTLAARHADTIALAVPPHTDEAGVAKAVTTVRASAAGRDIELNLNLATVGDQLPPWLAAALSGARSRLADATTASVAILRGTHAQRRDLLLRRREKLGISYITAPAAFAADLAPLVADLTGT
jgi:alkanesulfonate monooxygenase SsuD/methylene tetrahydromethanopterin reductase-like flavin-dependent oxidoreductase (luciferase family)